MNCFVLAATLQTTLFATGAASYAEAYKSASESGKPIVVLVGADWCHACQIMKNTAIPQLAQIGGLQRVAFSTVNTDHERGLAQELTGGGSIPQLVMYHQTPSGWQRRVMTGAHSPSAIQDFINQGLVPPAGILGRR